MDLLNQFRNYLKSENKSSNTVKNYCSDLSTYVDYLKIQNSYFSVLTLPFIFRSEMLEGYKKYLVKKTLPIATINRRLAALRKFTEFAISHQLVDRNNIGVVKNIDSPIGRSLPEKEIESFRKFLISRGNSTNTVKGYTSDIKYHLGLRTTASTTRSATGRRFYSLKKFIDWKNQNYYSATTKDQDGSTPKLHNKFLYLALIATFLVGGITLVTLINSRYRSLHGLAPKGPVTNFALSRPSNIPNANSAKDPIASFVFLLKSEFSPTHQMSSIFTRMLQSPKPIDPTEVGTKQVNSNVLGKSTFNFRGWLMQIVSPGLICPMSDC